MLASLQAPEVCHGGKASEHDLGLRMKGINLED